MNIKREVELLKSMGFEVTEASLQAEKDKHAARIAEDVKRREADRKEAEEIGEVLQWVGGDAELITNLEAEHLDWLDMKQQENELRNQI